MIKLNRLRLFTKIVDELEKQNKEIEEQITHKRLTKGKK